VIYLPPDAVLPSDLASSFKGQAKLFGERRNRVRPYRLRRAVSEGLLLGPIPCGRVGDDAASTLGVVKYEQPIPTPWRGECVHLPGLTVPYDIRSARRWPKVIGEGEPVEIAEKLHGTMCAIGYFPRLNNLALPDGDTLVYSKGLSETGHALKAPNAENLYLKAADNLAMRERLRAAFSNRPVTVFGEVYGATIQDLSYGRADPSFSAFDIYLGIPGAGRWLDREEFNRVIGEIAPSAPVLYSGILWGDIVQRLASGATVAGNMAHMREGVVVRPLKERTDPRIGRAIVKYISPEYLTRAGGTEFQ
jgi:RNA ligase (TIGR02306 family)